MSLRGHLCLFSSKSHTFTLFCIVSPVFDFGFHHWHFADHQRGCLWHSVPINQFCYTILSHTLSIAYQNPLRTQTRVVWPPPLIEQDTLTLYILGCLHVKSHVKGHRETFSLYAEKEKSAGKDFLIKGRQIHALRWREKLWDPCKPGSMHWPH